MNVTEFESLKKEYEEAGIDTYEIYQLKNDKSEQYLFEPLDRLTACGLIVECQNYLPVYIAPLDDISTYISESTRIIGLEKLYERFNLDRPRNFTGHSLSVSDIVAIQIKGEKFAYYVDSVGYKKITNFFGEHAANGKKRDLEMG